MSTSPPIKISLKLVELILTWQTRKGVICPGAASKCKFFNYRPHLSKSTVKLRATKSRPSAVLRRSLHFKATFAQLAFLGRAALITNFTRRTQKVLIRSALPNSAKTHAILLRVKVRMESSTRLELKWLFDIALTSRRKWANGDEIRVPGGDVRMRDGPERSASPNRNVWDGGLTQKWYRAQLRRVVEPWLGADGFTVTRGTDFQCESFSAQGRVQVVEKRVRCKGRTQ